MIIVWGFHSKCLVEQSNPPPTLFGNKFKVRGRAYCARLGTLRENAHHLVFFPQIHVPIPEDKNMKEEIFLNFGLDFI